MAYKTRRQALKDCAALSSLLLAACSNEQRADSPSTSRDGPRLLDKDGLSPLEQKFGVGPAKSARTSGNQFVKLRPDVHVVEQGPAAIRAVAANGLSWTLDPKITGPIESGRVLLVTNRCAGRVLATRPAGDQIEVILGPADLGDYIDEAKISLEQPIDFSRGLMFEAPDYPGAVTKVGGSAAPPPTAWAGSAPRMTPAFLTAEDWHGGFRHVQLGEGIAADPRFKVTPFISPATLGVQVVSLNDAIRMMADVRLHFWNPSLTFTLDMGGSKILNAAVRLSGVGSLQVTFRAHSNHGVHGNVRTRHFVPVDCCIPIGGFVVPFSATMRHVFMLQTAFSSKGNVDAQGQYSLGGSIGMNVGGGGVTLDAAPTFEVDKSLVKSVAGVTMGPAGLILTHQVRAIVGIGAFGFVTGPYAGVTSTAAVNKGSSAGMTSEQCREATLRISMHGGVGYSMPMSVVNAINTVFSLFHIKGIPAEGGIQSPDQTFISTTEHYPDLRACQSTPQA